MKRDKLKIQHALLALFLAIVLAGSLWYRHRQHLLELAAHAQIKSTPGGSDAYFREMQKLKTVAGKPREIIGRFADQTLLVETAAGPWLRVGLNKDVKREEARLLAQKIVTLPVVKNASKNPAFLECPARGEKLPLVGDLALRPPSENLLLVCAPVEACTTFAGDFLLQWQNEAATNVRVLGEVYDLIWKTGTCAQPPARGASPERIVKAYLGSA